MNTANKKMKLYYCEICGSMIFNGSFLQGEFKSIVHTCCNNSFIYIYTLKNLGWKKAI